MYRGNANYARGTMPLSHFRPDAMDISDPNSTRNQSIHTLHSETSLYVDKGELMGKREKIAKNCLRFRSLVSTIFLKNLKFDSCQILIFSFLLFSYIRKNFL